MYIYNSICFCDFSFCNPLQIYTSDHWAKICLDGFDLLVGDVVCKQRGYIAAVRFEAKKGYVIHAY